MPRAAHPQSPVTVNRAWDVGFMWGNIRCQNGNILECKTENACFWVLLVGFLVVWQYGDVGRYGGFQITWDCVCVSKFKRLLRDDATEETMHSNHRSMPRCLNFNAPKNQDKTDLRSVFFRRSKTSLNRSTKVRMKAAMESQNLSFSAYLRVLKSVTPRRWNAKSRQKCRGQRARSQWLLIGLGICLGKRQHAGK